MIKKVPGKAPGKAHREGLTLLQVADRFSDEKKAKAWLTERLWPDGPHCPECGSLHVSSDIKHRTMTHRCLDCPGKPFFSLRKGTIMESSKLPYRVWAIGIYLFTTNLKGVSSLKLHRELGIGQKAAWFMLHRLRSAVHTGSGMFSGPVEFDEVYMGGKRKNMSKSKRKALKGRGASGKTAVVGAKDRKTNKVRAKVVEKTDAETLQEFVIDVAETGATVYTDDASAYKGIPHDHESVRHSVGEYVRDMAHTNGIESFWSMLKRAHKGVYHKMSPKHLQRYVDEFSGRHSIRELDTLDQMAHVAQGMAGKRLRYEDLVR